MKIEKARYAIISPLDGTAILKHIEACGRVSYASEDRTTENSAEAFVRARIKDGHETLLEHFSFTTMFVVDRGVMAELTRHRLASFTVQSTRFCNYSKDKFGNEITVIKPCFWDEKSEEYQLWEKHMRYTEEMYIQLIHAGATPEKARSVLPNSLKTVIVMTANLREYRTILKLRCAKNAHPSIREVMMPLLKELQERVPVVFEDIEVE